VERPVAKVQGNPPLFAEPAKTCFWALFIRKRQLFSASAARREAAQGSSCAG
jgi:hypothetical protein